MFKSILITAIRNIMRNRAFSIINLLGLSISMSLALLVIIIIKEQYSFDNFHHDDERIFRINTRAMRVTGGTEDYASSPLPVAAALKDEYAVVENLVRINQRFNADAIYANVNVPLNGLLADQSFLEVFNFPLAIGNPSTALKDPRSVILTQQAKEKLFGETEALGKTITLSGFGEFIVTGVLKQIRGKTHFTFEMLGSMNAMESFQQAGAGRYETNSWTDYYANL
jgi:putative ABC transport system permease protein